MPRQPIDLSNHINQSVERGHPADFPVSLEPIYKQQEDSFVEVPRKLAVVRQDTGATLSVVSNRYTLVPHQGLLDLVDSAIQSLNVGPVPRGIYVDRNGARMRALFKFPALARPVLSGDEICPCLKIQNTYDGTSRIAVHIGAFRFVCTNLAVGGGGVFAGGFMSVHAGEIPMEEIAEQLTVYLSGFGSIAELYRVWAEVPAEEEALRRAMSALPESAATAIRVQMLIDRAKTVYEAYNVATHYATHEMRSYRTAFDLLAKINRGFQQQYAIYVN